MAGTTDAGITSLRNQSQFFTHQQHSAGYFRQQQIGSHPKACSLPRAIFPNGYNQTHRSSPISHFNALLFAMIAVLCRF
jgi:hypothetical protein